MNGIRIGRREITPLFDLAAWEALEDKGVALDRLLVEIDAHKPWAAGEEIDAGDRRTLDGVIWQATRAHKAAEDKKPGAAEHWQEAGRDSAAHRRKMIIMLTALLCNNALEARGEKPDVTEEQIKHGVPPKYLPQMRLACVMAISKGMRSDYDEADEEPVDVVLEEITKKHSPGE